MVEAASFDELAVVVVSVSVVGWCGVLVGGGWWWGEWWNGTRIDNVMVVPVPGGVPLRVSVCEERREPPPPVYTFRTPSASDTV